MKRSAKISVINGHRAKQQPKPDAKSSVVRLPSIEDKICPRCGTILDWWKGLPHCHRCGWQEGCCD